MESILSSIKKVPLGIIPHECLYTALRLTLALCDLGSLISLKLLEILKKCQHNFEETDSLFYTNEYSIMNLLRIIPGIPFKCTILEEPYQRLKRKVDLTYSFLFVTVRMIMP